MKKWIIESVIIIVLLTSYVLLNRNESRSENTSLKTTSISSHFLPSGENRKELNKNESQGTEVTSLLMRVNLFRSFSSR